jgi:hypothetical protein
LLPLSKDTLLRIVRLHASKAPRSPNVVGIWKRGHRYGTIICDLERRALLICSLIGKWRRSRHGSRSPIHPDYLP